VTDETPRRERRRAERSKQWRQGAMADTWAAWKRPSAAGTGSDARPEGLPPVSGSLDREIDAALDLLRSLPPEELQLRGWHLQPNHFHTPLNDLGFLRAHPELWNRSKVPAEVDWDLDGQLELLGRIAAFAGELNDVPDGPRARPGEFVWNNETYPRGDAITYYGILRHLQPRRVIEVGAGSSSLVLARAVSMNEKACEVTLIEPEPNWNVLGQLPRGWTVIEELVQLVDVRAFEALGPGDVLFYDGSHCVRTASDVNWIFFEVLPRLASGVWIHVHDLSWPWDYSPRWVLDEALSWNEQYLVQAFLMGNTMYQVRCVMSLLWTLRRSDVTAMLGTAASGGSLWIEKLAGPSAPGCP
jgi:Methyltransferase domain